uniref:Uncharacterized protein n=1 Tax=Arundo donax TaxID=35708 RepID=A0A0A9F0H4_ARUDO
MTQTAHATICQHFFEQAKHPVEGILLVL